MSPQQERPNPAFGAVGKLFVGIRGLLLVAGVLAVTVGLTILVWRQSVQSLESQASQRFQFEADELEEAITDRMIAYEQVLWSGVGLFNASDEVSRSEWTAFTASLHLDEQWPGIQGVGYSIPLRPDELDSHVASIRAEGFPNYTVRPETPRPEYSSIIYLEPFDERNRQAFGFDMWSNEVRRAAMTRARDEGIAATSGAITLVQEIDDDVQRGFLTYVPVYSTVEPPPTVAARRAAFRGWVYAPFRAGDLMTGIVGGELGRGVSFEVFDGTEVGEGSLLYDSNDVFQSFSDGSSDHVTASAINLHGRTWTLVVYSTPDFVSPGDARQPLLVLGIGVIANLLIASVVFGLWQLKRRATNLAQRMTFDLRMAKDDLENRSEQLATRAAELEVSYANLAEANNDLTTVNAELEQFIFTAAHDLQAPLRVINNYASFIDDGSTELTADQLDCIDRISASAVRMSDLLVDLLNYARLGRDAQPEAVDLEQMARSVVDDVIHDRSVTVEIGQLPTVTAHRTQIRLLFQNLIDNAVKFARSEEPLRVEIQAHQQGRMTVVSVADNGVGFNNDFRDKIFSVFHRLGHTDDRPGTGIGLANCRKIARLHGGEAWAESEPGVGSTFFFSLASDNATLGEGPPVAAEQAADQRPVDTTV